MIPSALVAQLQRGLRDYLRYSFWSSTPGMERVIEDLLAEPGAVTKGPYLELKLPFQPGSNPRFFPEVPLPFTPHAHQEQAFGRLGGDDKRHTLVATGTGSGKTECFLFPILDHCRQAQGRGVKAILIYPMNALATDQAGRIARMVHEQPALRGIRAGLYIGRGQGKGRTGEPSMGPDHVITDRTVLRDDPPDILLTNYKMLDYLLIRPDDRALWKDNGPGVLRFLVVDELHTFDGAQGTDLACLVRRLKHRLEADNGSLCCVGTSATLGGDDAVEQLLTYASDVFGESLEADCIVGESRLDVAQFLAGASVDETTEPVSAASLAPGAFDSPKAWARAQAALWFDRPPIGDGAEWAVALGERLRHHRAVRGLLEAVKGVASLDDVVQVMGRARPAWVADPEFGKACVLSLLGLVSAARLWREELPEVREARLARGAPRPTARFLDVRVQFWQRVLTRLVAEVSEHPRARFSDDLEREQRRNHLPLVHCRECGAMGWGTRIDRDRDRQLHCDAQSFYRGFFGKDPSVEFLWPANAPFPRPTEPMRVHGSELRELDTDEEAPTVVHLAKSTERTTKDGRRQLSRECPFCGAPGSLTIVGFRAATLSGVYVDQLFASRFNDDKRLLAFNDSVQDAAHRAGFFSARTWRTCLRVAMRSTLERQEEEPTLAAFIDAFAEDWRDRLKDEAWLATFLAPNMDWLGEWEQYQRTGSLPNADLPNMVRKRLAYEAIVEFGLQVGVGRSLTRTGAAAAYLPAETLRGVAAALLETLRNELAGLEDLDEDRLARFLSGLLYHLRKRGGIYHACLPTAYIETGGSDVFSFTRAKYLPRYGPSARVPALLSSRARSGAFEHWSGASRQTWYEMWVGKALVGDGLGTDAASLFPLLAPALATHGLLCALEGRDGAVHYGLSPDALRVTSDVAQLVCDRCGRPVRLGAQEAPLWVGSACVARGCAGHYGAADSGRPDYFGRLYAFGQLQRIFAKEHTGLLERDEREDVEQRFKARPGSGAEARKPWDPNLLSCTPTLEMGIDIGDLSTTMLCSVPPSQASYLQRIGRAGRRDGNALVVTVAGARPHDLYFYAQPEAMMDGEIAPPGVFLEAAAVLERQLAAFCLDRWVQTLGDEARIPRTLKRVLPHVGKPARERFPYPLIDWIQAKGDVLLGQFVRMFKGRMAAETQQHLQRHLFGEESEAGLAWRLLDILESEKQALAGHRREARRLDKERQELESTPARPLDFDARMEELEKEKDAVLDLAVEIEKRQTLEFLTDHGFLPNYAFPESPVRLKSVIWRRRTGGGSGRKWSVKSHKYARAPAMALSEFAPGAMFYAGGRHVSIDRVDLASSKVETWRFCMDCSHAERTDSGDAHLSCPSCGDDGWGDPGQLQKLVKLRQVYARTSDRDSRIRDESDERQPRFFERQILMDFRDEDRGGAWNLEGSRRLFGFELLRRATFREFNFGRRGDDGQVSVIGGKEAIRPGFSVCAECGKVQHEGKDKQHALSCRGARRPETAEYLDCLYLYRSFHSEAIRLLLPVAEGPSTQKLNSFTAALGLGLRLRFGGSVDHLKTMFYSEPAGDTGLRKQYLVIYDGVPGGTGYLKQLVEEGGEPALMTVLELARDHIAACPHEAADDDGCYRCVYAYRNARTMDDTSARLAVEMLSEILASRGDLTQIPALSEVSVSALLDSALEERFLEALRRAEHAGRYATLTADLHGGRNCYRWRLGGVEWLVEPQVSIGAADGVAYPSRADFVMWPQTHATLPVAVFLDGWRFHRDKVAKDLIQRQLILASGSFDVWTLTWDDVSEQLNHEVEAKPDLLRITHDVSEMMSTLGVHGWDGVPEAPPFSTFLHHLIEPRPVAEWEKFAHALALSRCVHQRDSPDRWSVARGRVPDAARGIVPEEVRSGALGLTDVHEYAHVDVGLVDREPFFLAYLDNRASALEDRRLRRAWRGFLHAFQMLRHLPNALFCSADPNENWGLIEAVHDVPEEEGWATDPEITEDVDKRCLPLCRRLVAEGFPRPEPGLELADAHGELWGTTELAWEGAKVAVLGAANLASTIGDPEPGWVLFRVEHLVEDEVVAALRERLP